MNALGGQIGMKGIAFVEFSGSQPETLEKLFFEFGFSHHRRHAGKAVDLFSQNEINFLLNREPGSFARRFAEKHGPSIPSMGWLFRDAKAAFEMALKRGAKACTEADYPAPAIYGIGESLIYFLDADSFANSFSKLGFTTPSPFARHPDKGFVCIDHLTNNVYRGTMAEWVKFYKDVFEFSEVRTFDIHGKKTGLQSYALRSPCGTFCIPINEAEEKKSQINEYLEEYHGPGIQHLAFLTKDILKSLAALERTSIKMLDIQEGYYEKVFSRVPNVREDKEEIRRRSVLVDGDDKGYLLQIFTKNIIGPIFVEIIQRENHLSFGEGNFQALFDSIERDQEKRGVFS